MEQGFARGPKLIFHLKQFLRRSFDVGSSNGDLQIREVRRLAAKLYSSFHMVKNNSIFQFERQYELLDFHHMTMKVRAETAIDTESYEASYKKILY